MSIVYLPHLGASVALQSGTVGGNTSGASTFFGSNVVWAGGSNVTLQASIDTIYIHGASAGTDTGGGGAGTDWAITGGSITVNTSGGTISLPAYLTTAAPVGALTTAAQSDHSHGSLSLVNLTGTSSSNGLTLSAAAPGGGAAIMVSAGTTSGNVQTLRFQDSNGVSFGLNGSTVTASHNGYTGATTQWLTTAQPPGAYLTTAAQVSHSHAFATTSTTGASIVVGTSNSAGATIGVPAYLTTQSGQAYSVGSGSQTFQTLVFTNSNGVSFGAAAGNITASVETAYAASTHTHGNGSLALTNLTGTTASASNGFTLSLSAAAPGGGAAQTFSAGTASGSANPVYFSNANGVSFGLGTGASSSVVTASVNAGGGAPSRSYIEIMNGERLTRPWNISASQFSNRPIFQPFWLDGAGLIPRTVRVFWSWVTNTQPPVMTIGAAIYELANSTQLTKVCATTQTINFASSQSASYTGNRAIDITGMTDSLGEGRKVLAVVFSGAATSAMNASLWGGDNFPNVLGYIAGGNATTATNNTVHVFPFWGVYTANSGTFPDSVGATQINGGRSADLVDLYAVVKEL